MLTLTSVRPLIQGRRTCLKPGPISRTLNCNGCLVVPRMCRLPSPYLVLLSRVKVPCTALCGTLCLLARDRSKGLANSPVGNRLWHGPSTSYLRLIGRLSVENLSPGQQSTVCPQVLSNSAWPAYLKLNTSFSVLWIPALVNAGCWAPTNRFRSRAGTRRVTRVPTILLWCMVGKPQLPV